MIQPDTFTRITWSTEDLDNEHHWRRMTATRFGCSRVRLLPTKQRAEYELGAVLCFLRWLSK